MAERLRKLRDYIRDWGTMLTVLGFIVVQWTKIERHDSTIAAWQMVGTPAVVSMRATYEERFRSWEERIKKLEDIAVSNANGIQDIKAELRGSVVELKLIKEAVSDHVRETRSRP